MDRWQSPGSRYPRPAATSWDTSKRWRSTQALVSIQSTLSSLLGTSSSIWFRCWADCHANRRTGHLPFPARRGGPCASPTHAPGQCGGHPLDQQIGGRAELGAGAGAFSDGIAGTGRRCRTPSEAVGATREALEILRLALTSSGPVTSLEDGQRTGALRFGDPRTMNGSGRRLVHRHQRRSWLHQSEPACPRPTRSIH